jgi:hypothetical protein
MENVFFSFELKLWVYLNISSMPPSYLFAFSLDWYWLLRVRLLMIEETAIGGGHDAADIVRHT